MMSILLTLVLVTLARSMSYAAPDSSVPAEHLTPPPQVQPLKENSIDKDVWQTSATPKASLEGADRLRASRFVYEKAFTLGAGLWLGDLQSDYLAQTTIYLSGSKIWYTQDESSYELEARVAPNGLIGAQGIYREYCCLGKWQEPYWGAGLSATYKPNELLVGFIKLNSYQAVGEIGLDNFLHMQRRLRFGWQLAWGPIGFSTALRLNYLFDATSEQ